MQASGQIFGFLMFTVCVPNFNIVKIHKTKLTLGQAKAGPVWVKLNGHEWKFSLSLETLKPWLTAEKTYKV